MIRSAIVIGTVFLAAFFGFTQTHYFSTDLLYNRLDEADDVVPSDLVNKITSTSLRYIGSGLKAIMI